MLLDEFMATQDCPSAEPALPFRAAPELAYGRGWVPDWADDVRPAGAGAVYKAPARASRSGHAPPASHAPYAHPRTVPPVPHRMPPGARPTFGRRLRSAMPGVAAMSAVAGSGAAGLIYGSAAV